VSSSNEHTQQVDQLHEHQRSDTDTSYTTTTTDGSDVEAYLEKKRRPRNRDGEGLLFRDDAYGQTGHGLPGIFDSDDGPGPSTWSNTSKDADPHQAGPRGGSFTTSRPLTAQTAASRQGRRTVSNSNNNNYPRRHHHDHRHQDTSYRSGVPSFSTWQEEEDDAVDSELAALAAPDLNLEQLRRLALHAVLQNSSLLSERGALDDALDDLDEQLDAQLAMRLRREIKRRERIASRLQTLSKMPATDAEP
jgi:hypothetical protein